MPMSVTSLRRGLSVLKFKTPYAWFFACSAIGLASPLSAQQVVDAWESWETDDPQEVGILSEFRADADTAGKETEQKIGKDRAIAAALSTSDAGFGPIPQRINVTSGISGETVKLTIGQTIDEFEDFKTLQYAVSFTAPFDKDEERGSFVTQTGLPGAFSAEVTISGSIVSPKDGGEIFDSRRSDVASILIDSLSSPRVACLADKKTPAEDRTKVCNALSAKKLVQNYGTPKEKAQVQSLLDSITQQLAAQEYVGWQIAGSIGREAFDHRDPVTLAKIDADKTVFSLSSSITYVPHLDKPYALVIGGEVERDFELPAAETRCPAAANDEPTVTCFTASFGPPERKTTSTIFASVRYTDFESALPFGGELRLAIDPESGNWGAEMPIYFLRSQEGRLNGGVRLAYDSKQDDGFVGLFVGTAFPGS